MDILPDNHLRALRRRRREREPLPNNRYNGLFEERPPNKVPFSQTTGAILGDWDKDTRGKAWRTVRIEETIRRIASKVGYETDANVFFVEWRRNLQEFVTKATLKRRTEIHRARILKLAARKIEKRTKNTHGAMYMRREEIRRRLEAWRYKAALKITIAKADDSLTQAVYDNIPWDQITTLAHTINEIYGTAKKALKTKERQIAETMVKMTSSQYEWIRVGKWDYNRTDGHRRCTFQARVIEDEGLEQEEEDGNVSEEY